MEKLSPAEMAILRAWYEYVHNHRPRLYCEDESQNDTINRQRLGLWVKMQATMCPEVR